MRHKWKKLEVEPICIEGDNSSIYTIFKPMECIQCGLRKGHARTMRSHFSSLIYFLNDNNNHYDKDGNVISTAKALSYDKLPYKCYEAPNSMFIGRDDFNV